MIIPPHEEYHLTAEEGRIQVWERGLGYMTSYPVFGVGVRNFPVAEGTISPQARRQERGLPVRWGAAHNTYIQIGAELGIPGLLLFLGLLWSTFAALRRAGRRRGATTREVPRLSRPDEPASAACPDAIAALPTPERRGQSNVQRAATTVARVRHRLAGVRACKSSSR